jgi:nitroreductase
MEFRDVLRRRRMHRSFLPDPVEPEVVERIARIVRRAPSAGFSQGTSVVVVTDEALRREIAERSGEASYVAEGWPPFMSTAPVHLVVCVDEGAYHRRYTEPDKLEVGGGQEIRWPVPFWWIDAGCALMLVLLAAIDEGLATALWGDPHQDDWLPDLLGLPAGVLPLGITAVGHPAPDPRAEARREHFARRRRPHGEVVHWQRWGGAS